MSKKNRLREIIEERGIKQSWIAQKAGISASGLNELIHERQAPTLDTARKIARALGMPLEEIWPEE